MGSILFGYFAHELFVGAGSDIYFNSLFTHPNRVRFFDSSLSTFTVLKLIVSLPLIFIISLLPLKKELNLLRIYNKVHTFDKTFATKPINAVPLYWSTRILSHFNILNHWIMHNSLNQSISLYRYFDKGLLQLIGPFGIYRYLNFASFNLEILYTGFIIHYAFLTLFTLFLMVHISYVIL